MITDKLLQSLLNTRLNKEGFTIPLQGSLKRYVVALTNNTGGLNIPLLTKEINIQMGSNENVNIGGWLDKNTLQYYVDVSTSTDDLAEAMKLGKIYSQIAIWDNEKQIEITM